MLGPPAISLQHPGEKAFNAPFFNVSNIPYRRPKARGTIVTQTMCSILGAKIKAAGSNALAFPFALTSESQHAGLRHWKPEF